jgi:predicted regulator of Ras-like GTPase activity (Roadblock/LC7/MglB family)
VIPLRARVAGRPRRAGGLAACGRESRARWWFTVPLLALAACNRAGSGTRTESVGSGDGLVVAGSAAPAREVATLGAFSARSLTESSAAVQSVGHPGVYWTLNDSGHDARLFAFDTAGRDLGTVRLTGARNRDWEAMATGPCAAGRCLYVGDVGDNFARRNAVVIWRVPEPVPPGPGADTHTEAARALTVRYPDGPRDVEALWVDADTVVWLATKRPQRDAQRRWRPALVYRVPANAWHAPPADPVVAELVDSLPIVPRSERTLVTDAAMRNPFGDPALDSLLAIRTYGELLILRVGRMSGRPQALVGHCDLTPLRERQGEGVAWLSDGRVLLTSEKRFAPLRAVRCP